MIQYFFAAFSLAIAVVRTAPVETSMQSTSSEGLYLPPMEKLPEISSYEYTPTNTGYSYRLSLTNSIIREETFEIKNEGTPEVETVVIGQYSFRGDDGYKYFIKYTIDKNGVHAEVDRLPIHRIPPNALKSLVG